MRSNNFMFLFILVASALVITFGSILVIKTESFELSSPNEAYALQLYPEEEEEEDFRITKKVFGREIKFIEYKDILIPDPLTYESTMPPLVFTYNHSSKEHYFNIAKCDYIFDTKTNELASELGPIKAVDLVGSYSKESTIGIIGNSTDFTSGMLELTKMGEFFSIFVEVNGLLAVATGGTLIGYCRQRHLLPWDNDYDFLSRPEDYGKYFQLFEYFSMNESNYYDPNLKDSLSDEGWRIRGPLKIEIGDLKMLMLWYDEPLYFKLFTPHNIKIEIRDYHDKKDKKKVIAQTYIIHSLHIDVHSCDERKSKKKCVFFGYKYPRKTMRNETITDYPQIDFCGIPTRFPEKCGKWLDLYFSGQKVSGTKWRLRKRPKGGAG